MLWTTYVAPQPLDESNEQRVRSRLQQIDALLDLRWMPTAVVNTEHQKFEGRYALLVKWPIIDKRYELIRSGEIGDFPYDILGWFTDNIQDANSPAVAPDMLEQRIQQLLASADNERSPWKDRMRATIAKNAAVKAAQRSELEAITHDAASYLRNQIKHLPIVGVHSDVVDNTGTR